MTPPEKKTTTESLTLFRQTLEGGNYSPQSIKAYLGDLGQFIEWLKTRRVDWDIPYRMQRIDIVEFINHLAKRKATAVTRKRKLAAIRGFLKFCKDNQIIFGNPADTIEGPIREERDPAILLKTEYKALLQVAGGNIRDFAIVMLFLQTGLRVSELVNLKLTDVDFTSREITVRLGKGRKDRVVPLVKQAADALKAYLAMREAQPEYDEVFIARNGTSMDVRTVRYRIQKYYKEAGIKKKASVHTLRHTFSSFDHGVGHPLLFLCDAKAPNCRKNKALKDLGHYSEWPKVADAVIKAKIPLRGDCGAKPLWGKYIPNSLHDA